jgi:hypothetical protein
VPPCEDRPERVGRVLWVKGVQPWGSAGGFGTFLAGAEGR